MFQLNDEFLKELGLDQLPEDQRKPFLDHIYSELELRVGERLSQGMSDAQLDEFANIIDRFRVRLRIFWLSTHQIINKSRYFSV